MKKEKYLSIRNIFLFLVLLSFSQSIHASSREVYSFVVDNIYYLSIGNNKVRVTYKTLTESYSVANGWSSSTFSPYDGDVIIPASVIYNNQGYTVTEIGEHAFDDCDVTSVFLPNTITKISDFAFTWCEKLKFINIPNSVTSIGNQAFYNCPKLTSITIPNSVTSIGNQAFYDCKSLTSVTISNSVTSIGNQVFYNCPSITSINIPNSVTSIGERAFARCSSLTSITIPNSVTSIGDYAFEGCSSFASVIVESGNKVYDSRYNCNAIIETSTNTLISGCKNTIIPNSVTSIGAEAFWGCSSLASITIPNSVTSIGSCAFSNCTNLASITIPNSVTSIRGSAFYNCFSLSSITIPNSVTSIGGAAFYNCSSLASITIPNSVTSIVSSAFSGCNFTKEEFINNSKLDAEANNYWGATICDIIQEDGLCINNHVAVGYRGKPTSITIPNSVTSIGEKAFSNYSSLISITIPNSVTSIGSEAFAGCSSLTSITNLATTPQKIDVYTFSKYGTLHVYESLIDLYKADTVWGKFTVVDDIPTQKATSITLDSTTYHCEVNGTVSLLAKVSSVATIQNVSWATADSTILSIIDANKGQFKGLKIGKTTITATTIDGSKLSTKATVFVGNYIPVTSVALNKTTASMMVDDSLTLKATVLPENATQKTCTWTSSNDEVATVDKNGKVMAKSVGTATITATSKDNTSLSATCTITVNERPAADTDYSKMNNAIYIEKKEARVGSQYDLSINLKNEATFGGFQFDLYLPEGITVDLDEYEEPIFEKSSRINAKATLEAATQIDGSTRFLCYSTKNYAITDTDGEILTVTLNISDELGDGNYPIYMKNIILSTTTSSKVLTQDMKSTITLSSYTLGDVNDDKSIDVVDISCIASYILGNKPEPFIEKAADFNEDESIDVVDISSLASYILNGPAMSFVPRTGLRAETETPANLQIIPFAIQPGEELDIDIELNNPDYSISGTQYDIYLPEGLSFALDEYEEPIISGSRGSKITTEGAIQGDGALRMLSYSSKNYVYSGTEGAIATITIKADENMKAGVYALQLRNMFLTKYVNKVATKVVPADYDGSIVVGTPAEKNITLVGNLTSDALDMVNTVWGESTTVASFDMTQTVDVDAETEIVTGNANTLYYIGAGKALANESNVVVDGTCAQLTLTDGNNYNAPVAFEATNAQYTRNFKNHNWQALYLPYEVAVSAISGNFEVAEMTAASTGDAVVIEKLTSGTLAANKPYFIRLKSDKTTQDYTFSATNQDIAVTATNPQTYGDFTLTGIYEAMNGTQMQTNNAFGLSEGKFCKALDASAKLNAFRFYLTGASSDVKIVVDGETGINDVDVDADVDTIYNLAGQKLVKAQKGVNIMNGKKVIF